MSHVLLVSPAFHGYWRSIAEALVRAGHEVTTYAYDSLNSRRAKVRHKLIHELPKQFGYDPTAAIARDFTRGAIEVLASTKPDVVFTIKGDQLGSAYWDAVATSGARRITWFYDELRRMHHSQTLLAEIGPLASYSALDCAALSQQGIEMTYVPLAFDQYVAQPMRHPAIDEVVFIGARYPKRAADLTALHRAGAPVRAYGHFWSRHLADRARTFQWSRPELPTGRELNRKAAYELQCQAIAALNIHGDQDGFTMRTFEVCGMGGLQLCDRADVSSLYDPDSELAVFENVDELIELAQRARADRIWADSLREAGRARTLAEHTFDHRISALESLWA